MFWAQGRNKKGKVDKNDAPCVMSVVLQLPVTPETTTVTARADTLKLDISDHFS